MQIDNEIITRHVNRLFTLLCSGKYFTAVDRYNSDYLCTTAFEVCNASDIFLLKLFTENEAVPDDFEKCETNGLAKLYCKAFCKQFGIVLEYNENFLLPVHLVKVA